MPAEFWLADPCGLETVLMNLHARCAQGQCSWIRGQGPESRVQAKGLTIIGYGKQAYCGFVTTRHTLGLDIYLPTRWPAECYSL